jgi:hypothetical protein
VVTEIIKPPSMPQGNCSLCGTFCDLTFEHVPPRAAFNKRTRYKSVPMLDVLKSDNILKNKFRGKVEQGGVGYYSLCGKCNSFLGLNYVNDYVAYSNTFIDFAKKKEFDYFELEMHNFDAVKVLKQIVSMFISLNSWQFSQNYPALRNYVLNPKHKELPSNIRIFSYLNCEGQFRNNTFSVVGDLNSNLNVLASELAFPPLGHVMTIDFNGSMPYHYELTHFKNYKVGELVSINFKLFRLPTHLPIPLDYRTKELIENAINKNI